MRCIRMKVGTRTGFEWQEPRIFRNSGHPNRRDGRRWYTRVFGKLFHVREEGGDTGVLKCIRLLLPKAIVHRLSKSWVLVYMMIGLALKRSDCRGLLNPFRW